MDTLPIITEIIDWRTLNILVEQGRIMEIDRTPEARERYYKYKLEVESRGIDYSDFIFTEKLRFDGINKDKSYVLTINEFPYHITNDIIHLIIWCREQCNDTFERAVNRIKMDVIELLDKSTSNILVVENPPDKKSVKKIPHRHIFIKVNIMERENLFKCLQNTEYFID